jgi:hypothetical protein
MIKRALTLLLCLSTSALAASPFVPLERYKREYRLLERAKTVGLLKDFDLTYKPLTQEDFARAIIEIYNNRKVDKKLAKYIFDQLYPEFKDVVNSLLKKETRSFIKPINDVSLRVGYTSDKEYKLPYSEGWTLDRGFNLRTTFSSYGKWKEFIFYLEPEERNKIFRLNRAYMLWEKNNFRVMLGRGSVYWGEGINGELLFSNNPRPWNMLKVESQKYEKLPWLLRYLGEFKLSAFISQLEKERVRSYAHVWGMRVTWRPIKSLEIGGTRAIQFGGAGRPNYNSLKDYWNVFVAKQENEPGSRYDNNQIAGYDVTYYLNWLNKLKFQPFRGGKLYFVYAGDDAFKPRGPGGFPLPLASGHIFGLSLTTGYTDFSFQYTETTDSAAHWYSHHNYPDGFTYHGYTIGSAIGGDSKDYYFEVAKDLKSIGNLKVSYDYTRHGVYHAPAEEMVKGISIELDKELGLDKISRVLPIKVFTARLYLKLSYLDYDNYENRTGEDKSSAVASLGVNLKF